MSWESGENKNGIQSLCKVSPGTHVGSDPLIFNSEPVGRLQISIIMKKESYVSVNIIGVRVNVCQGECAHDRPTSAYLCEPL